jgi:GT2 family glycosyltransferase
MSGPSIDGGDGAHTEAVVTIVVVPRERFGLTRESLESIFANTAMPFEMVYVDGNSPRKVKDYLAAESERRGFTLVRTEHYLSPNKARNIGVAHVGTKYVVFVDNDVFVTPGWLDRMVECADQTGAWVVGPLYCQGDPADQIIHMAGGSLKFRGEAPHRRMKDIHHFKLQSIPDVQDRLRRQPCDYAEFHVMLVRRDAFDRLGALDEELLCTREHIDWCLRVKDAGGEVYFEPGSIVTYRTPPPFELTDIPFYWLRWSDSWALQSLSHFCEKYGLDTRYLRRAKKMSHRRQNVFHPIHRAARRVLGRRGERAVWGALYVMERPLNRVVARRLARAA